MPDDLKLAVIRRPVFGTDDRGSVSLRFTAYVSEAGAADQYLQAKYAVEVLAAADASDVSELNGKTCWVREHDGLIEFVRMAKL